MRLNEVRSGSLQRGFSLPVIHGDVFRISRRCWNLLFFPRNLTLQPLVLPWFPQKSMIPPLILISLIDTKFVEFCYNVKKKNHDYFLYFRHCMVSRAFALMILRGRNGYCSVLTQQWAFQFKRVHRINANTFPCFPDHMEGKGGNEYSVSNT